jgi:hypothetical protein
MALTVRTRGAAVAALVVVATMVSVAPASAADPGIEAQAPETMSVADAVLIFLGIPLLVVLLVWLLVSAPSWTRGGRPDAADAWTGEPHVVESQAVEPTDDVPAVGAEGPGSAVEAAEGTGGASARW